VDAAQFCQEGIEQHNCAASYAHAIQERGCRSYRVLSPERATLSISKGPDGSWAIQQLDLFCNRPVGQETQQSIQKWLEQFSLSI